MTRAAITGWILAVLANATAWADPIVFETPSDDRWHYPFNFTPGFRATASTFGSTSDSSFDTFNDRDGIFLIAWETGGRIEPGLDPAEYDVRAVRVTLTATAGDGSSPGDFPVAHWPVDLTVDDWSRLRSPMSDTDLGQPIELFGVGFGKFFNPDTWDEFEFYVGGDADVFGERDPFPFVFAGETEVMLHVEDSVKEQFTPTPWAIGAPQGYTPGSQTVPFPVVFDLNLSLSGGEVKRYFQRQLASGKVFVAATSFFVTFQQATTGFPSFFTKEAAGPLVPGAPAPRLEVALTPTGDADGDEFVTLDDYGLLAGCLNGPDAAAGDDATRFQCLAAFDFDDDRDVDMQDVRRFLGEFDGD